MATITSKNLHRNVREVLDYVRFENGRVIITRRGRPIAVLMPFETKLVLQQAKRTQSAD